MLRNQTHPSSIEHEFTEGKLDVRPFEDRYYMRKYTCEADGGDYTFLVHSNKLCVIQLAPTHPVILNDFSVTSVTFHVSPEVNRLENLVSGKGKRGAQLITNTSNICLIYCKERAEPYIVKSSMVGKLLEVNTALVSSPQCLKANNHCYIAIISPRVSDFESQIDNLLTEDQYKRKIEARCL